MPCVEHGGEVDSMDTAGDDELLDACCGELSEALKTKDKKGILDALKAICMSCME